MSSRSTFRWIFALFLACATLLITLLLLSSASLQAHRLNSLINCSGSIQACIDSATDGDTIVIAAGDYTESLTLNKAVSLTGVNSATTIIHAASGQRVLTVMGATITNSTIISGMTLSGGNVSDTSHCPASTPSPYGVDKRFITPPTVVQDCFSTYGGGILLTALAQPTIQNLIVFNNSANEGGGTYNDVGSPLILIDTAIISNSAVSYGGGVYADADVTLIGGIFDNNYAYYDGGGLNANRPVTLTNTEFTHNRSQAGRANAATIWGPANLSSGLFISNSGKAVAGVFASRALFVSNTKFISNSSIALQGWETATIIASQFLSNSSGLYAYHLNMTNAVFINNATIAAGMSGASTIFHSWFENNNCTGFCQGGALSAQGPVTVLNSVFISNSAYDGGAIRLFFSNNSLIANSLFVGNVATTGHGSAVWQNGPASTLLLHNTIADANSSSASAIFIVTGSFGITDTIIANHSIPISKTGGTVYEDYNLFYGNLTNTLGSITSGGHSLIGDPKFVDPANNDYHLRPGSAAIDHGIDVGITTDLDGNPRDSKPDLGAYEFVLSVPISGLAAINNSPTTVGSSTLLTASVMSGTGVIYQWSFGDGQFGSGASIAHAYSTIGIFTAMVTATNGVSGPITAATFVTITDAPITGLHASNNSPMLIHRPTTFTAAISGGSSVKYQWNFGDGVTTTLSGLSAVTHLYATYGFFTAWVTATNSLSPSSAATLVIIQPYRQYLPIIYK